MPTGWTDFDREAFRKKIVALWRVLSADQVDCFLSVVEKFPPIVARDALKEHFSKGSGFPTPPLIVDLCVRQVRRKAPAPTSARLDMPSEEARYITASRLLKLWADRP